MTHLLLSLRYELWYYQGNLDEEWYGNIFIVKFETKAQRQNAFRQMRKSFNNLLKSLETEELFVEDHCITLEDYGYAARMETEGGPPDAAFAAFHEALMLAFRKAREIAFEPEASPIKE